MSTLKLYRLQIILGAVAVIAVIMTVILLTAGGREQGLYITGASGEVSITGIDGEVIHSVMGAQLKEGDIVTVGNGARCAVEYKGKGNSDSNFMVLGQNSRLVITEELTGKNNGEVLLELGSLICNFREEDKHKLVVRTAHSVVTPSNTVTRISYTEYNDGFFTEIHTFAGISIIQPYNLSGERVNDREPLVEKSRARIRFSDDGAGGPVFTALNDGINLEQLHPYDLLELVAVAQLYDDFPYTPAELRAVYDKIIADYDFTDLIPDDPVYPDDTAYDVTDDIPQTPQVTEAPDDNFDWEPPSVTTTTPRVTTAATTTAATSTAAATATTAPATPATTTTTTTRQTGDNRFYNVIFRIDYEETLVEVRHGERAIPPDVPHIPGKTFTGWDKPLDNITADTVITALFDGGGIVTPGVMHTVTIVIGGMSNTVQVEHGTAAPIPNTIPADSIPGYIFMGWDKDFSYVTSDMTVTAILQSAGAATEYIVTFEIDGVSYPTRVRHGEDAIPPIPPVFDREGRLFRGWDRPFTNVTSNLFVIAIYE